MKYREACVRVTQTISLISQQLSDSVNYLGHYKNAGLISEEEFSSYLIKVQHAVIALIDDLGEPIYQEYPDLRPVPPKCYPPEGLPED